MPDESKIELELKYPLYIKRGTQIWIVDSAHTPVAHFVNYHHAFEVVRLANCCYRLLSDLSQKPYENPAPSISRQDPG
jgi:hypothetical protein